MASGISGSKWLPPRHSHPVLRTRAGRWSVGCVAGLLHRLVAALDQQVPGAPRVLLAGKTGPDRTCGRSRGSETKWGDCVVPFRKMNGMPAAVSHSLTWACRARARSRRSVFSARFTAMRSRTQSGRASPGHGAENAASARCGRRSRALRGQGSHRRPASLPPPETAAPPSPPTPRAEPGESLRNRTELRTANGGGRRRPGCLQTRARRNRRKFRGFPNSDD